MKSTFKASFSILSLLAITLTAFAAPQARSNGSLMEKRARIKYNGEKCSKSVQCYSYNCERARCRSKKSDGSSCYKNANCLSGNCQSRSVCAAALVQSSSTTTSSAPALTTPLISSQDGGATTTTTSTITTSPTTTPTPIGTPASDDSNTSTSTDTLGGGSVDIPPSGSTGSDGGSVNLGGGGGGIAIVGSGSPIPSLAQLVAGLKANGDPFFNAVGSTTAIQQAAAAQALASSINTQLLAIQAQKQALQLQKASFANSPLPKSVVDQLDAQIDASIARLTDSANRFNAILDDLTGSIQDRGNTLNNLKNQA